MQLHACLLLFIITTDKTLALWQHRCGGNVSLDQEPAGLINLTSPGVFTDTDGLNSTSHELDEAPSLCTWQINIPPGRRVLLRVLRLDSGSNISVHCVLDKDDQILGNEGTVLLSGCAGSTASLTWSGAGRPSEPMQLSYHVQEDVRNSSEDHTSPHSDEDLVAWSQAGTSFASTTAVRQEVVRGTEGVRGHLYEGLHWSARPRPVSGPTSPLQGLTVAGRADRETLPFPQEGPNNGADTSGADPNTDGPISAGERTHPYFQNTLLHTDTPKTETNPTSELPQTRMSLTDGKAISSDTSAGTDSITHTSELVDKNPTTQSHPTLSSSDVSSLASSHSELPSVTSWESRTVLTPGGSAASGTPREKEGHSWRSQRSTDRLNWDVTSAITSDPLKPPSELPKDADVDTEPTKSSKSSPAPTEPHQSPVTHITELSAAVSTAAAALFHPDINRTDPFDSAVSDVPSRTAAFDKFDGTVKPHTPTAATHSQTKSPESTGSLTHSPHTSPSIAWTQTTGESTQRDLMTSYMTTNTVPSSPVITEVEDSTSRFRGSAASPRTAQTSGDVLQSSAATGTATQTYTLLHETSSTMSPSPAPHLPSSPSPYWPVPSYTPQTPPSTSHSTDGPVSLTTTVTKSTSNTVFADHRTAPTASQAPTISSASSNIPLLSSPSVPTTHEQPRNFVTTSHTPLLSRTTAKLNYGNADVEVKTEIGDESNSTTGHTPTAEPSEPGPPAWTSRYPGEKSRAVVTPSALTSTPTWSSKTSQTPKFYIVPDQPAAVRVESIELLLQIIVEESKSAFTAGLEEDTALWLEPYLQKAPGFSGLLEVWSSGHAVQSLVAFKTRGALQWLSMTSPTSLLEQTGLAKAAREGKKFRTSKVTNITLGGLQGDVCDWLLQCPAGYRCVSPPNAANYSCSSVCHFDYCHHHGICTHHPGQLPVCRCLVGEDFWYMGRRCDMRMTRARLVGTCLAILLIMVTVIGVLAFVAVRRYRAILIQAKVDQTRSSYRRFNHFDELSGRFWLRSWAGSADSLDNPAFTRSDELLHLRALDRPCCYHDDTLSLASTCPSHGARINTIYPHSSQYGWRGSEMSMGDGVLDSGKASDLSVCSWPVEPIQWTPFPLLQQLASHRTPTVRVSRPRSYCEGMELVDLGKSWTA
ncbi:flocculation protein FLO11 [Echeneis naucrates]|uniref:flocculation protein FLO11 n=1 Tax=Echeneis naucrates TaxID=173247 RepID=UPI0011140516|nr:flocculation protein FLO11-like [Echeneis naucrates]